VSDPSQPARSCPAASPVRLTQMVPGNVVRLHMADLPAQDCALLGALGLTDRCVLRICKVGEPCIVQVQSTRIGLSRSVADGILVVPETAG
jgi:Fe2+ transport system protein FeoA